MVAAANVLAAANVAAATASPEQSTLEREKVGSKICRRLYRFLRELAKERASAKSVLYSKTYRINSMDSTTARQKDVKGDGLSPNNGSSLYVRIHPISGSDTEVRSRPR